MQEPAVLVEGLVKRFGSLTALHGIDFEIPAGTVFGLLGPNGAGKTTAVRILATILRPDGGRARVLGHDVAADPQAVRSSIGLAGQSAAVDPTLTGRENLTMVGRLAHLPRATVRSRADELVQRFGLSHAADRAVKTYSGGMRRRLDVAAALVHRPPVIFLDEPTTGLDLSGRNELWGMIKELVADGATVLLTTQYLEEADRLAQRIAVVDHGRVIASDTPAALKARLGSTVIHLGFADELAAGRALETVASMVDDHPEKDGDSVRLSAQGPGVLIDLLRALESRKLVPTALAVREPSLDDVFLTLTGRHAEGPSPSVDGAGGGRRAGRRGP